MRQHNDVVGCQVLDPAEEALPAGRFPITDGETASLLDTGRSGGRKRFETMSLAHADGPRRLFQRHNCGWLVLNSDDDPVEVLGRELRILVGGPAAGLR
mgnify:CR=1 FL=1